MPHAVGGSRSYHSGSGPAAPSAQRSPLSQPVGADRSYHPGSGPIVLSARRSAGFPTPPGTTDHTIRVADRSSRPRGLPRLPFPCLSDGAAWAWAPRERAGRAIPAADPPSHQPSTLLGWGWGAPLRSPPASPRKRTGHTVTVAGQSSHGPRPSCSLCPTESALNVNTSLSKPKR